MRKKLQPQQSVGDQKKQTRQRVMNQKIKEKPVVAAYQIHHVFLKINFYAYVYLYWCILADINVSASSIEITPRRLNHRNTPIGSSKFHIYILKFTYLYFKKY